MNVVKRAWHAAKRFCSDNKEVIGIAVIGGSLAVSQSAFATTAGPSITFNDASFKSTLASIFTGAQSMFTDVMPYVVAIAGLVVLIKLVKSFTKKV